MNLNLSSEIHAVKVKERKPLLYRMRIKFVKHDFDVKAKKKQEPGTKVK